MPLKAENWRRGEVGRGPGGKVGTPHSLREKGLDIENVARIRTFFAKRDRENPFPGMKINTESSTPSFSAPRVL